MFFFLKMDLICFNSTAAEKLQMEVGDEFYSCRLVLEEDGTEVDDNKVLKIFKSKIFILVPPGGHWEPADSCLTYTEEVAKSTDHESINATSQENHAQLPTCMPSLKSPEILDEGTL